LYVKKINVCFVKEMLTMSKFAGEWSIPGGSVEKGEGIPHAAQREFYEETANVELEAHPFISWGLLKE
jgi:ADP-ribose pyrophosphatase YjhB (NUDIX family)